MTARDRIRLYVEYKGLSQSEFERRCGFSHGYISNMRRAPSATACSLIALHFPELDTDWLITGRGVMIRPEFGCDGVDETERGRFLSMMKRRDDYIRELEETILRQQATIDKLRNARVDT